MTPAAQSGPAAPEIDALAPLRLPDDLWLTPEQFEQVCAENPEAVLELGADGQLITMVPTGSETGARNSELIFQLQQFARSTERWKVFVSSAGSRLPVAARILRRSWLGVQHGPAPQDGGLPSQRRPLGLVATA